MNDIAAIEARLHAALDAIEAHAGRLAEARLDDAYDEDDDRALDLAPELAPDPETDSVPDPVLAAAAERAEAAEAELDRVRAALEAETAAHSQLADRVAAIRARQDEVSGQLEKRVLRLQERAETQERELAQLRQANSDLRAMARRLRRTIANSVPDAALVNAVMEAELKATHAAQTADRAELDAILAELTPLIEENAHV